MASHSDYFFLCEGTKRVFSILELYHQVFQHLFNWKFFCFFFSSLCLGCEKEQPAAFSSESRLTHHRSFDASLFYHSAGESCIVLYDGACNDFQTMLGFLHISSRTLAESFSLTKLLPLSKHSLEVQEHCPCKEKKKVTAFISIYFSNKAHMKSTLQQVQPTPTEP